MTCVHCIGTDMITDTQAQVVSNDPTVRQMALRNFKHLQKAQLRLHEVSSRLGEGHTGRVTEGTLPYNEANIDGIVRSTRGLVDTIEDTISDLEFKVGGPKSAARECESPECPTKCGDNRPSDAVVYPVTKLPSVLMREELVKRLASELGVHVTI